MSLTLRLLVPLLLALPLLVPPATAAPAAHLYSAEVPVTGQDPAERDAAIARALSEVAVKVSGDPKAEARVRSVRNPSALVAQYQYAVTAEGARVLRVAFDQAAIDALLRNSGVASWRGPRPSLLLWVGQEADGSRVLLNLEGDRDLSMAAQQAATSRGVSLSFPLADLQDQERLPAQALWAGDAAVIESASARYGTEAVLAGAITRRAGDARWRGAWTLLAGETGPQNFRSDGDSMADAIARAVDQAVGRLAADSAPPPATADAAGVAVQVRGVDSLRQYARVMRLLQSTEGVEAVTPRATRGDVLLVDVRARGGAEQLDRLVGLGFLEPDSPVPAGAGGPSSFAEARLRYRVRQ